MTVGERLALQQERLEEEERQQMTALQRRQRRRLEYMEVALHPPASLRPGRASLLQWLYRMQWWQGALTASSSAWPNGRKG